MSRAVRRSNPRNGTWSRVFMCFVSLFVLPVNGPTQPIAKVAKVCCQKVFLAKFWRIPEMHGIFSRIFRLLNRSHVWRSGEMCQVFRKSLPLYRFAGPPAKTANPMGGAIDHFGVLVPSAIFSDLVQTYKTLLEPLGITEIKRFGGPEMGNSPIAVGMGDAPSHHAFLWFTESREIEKAHPMHLAFKAENRKLVDEFHEAALKAGLKDNGKPGPRPHYHEDYYGAFVIDQAGNNLEAVCNKAEA